jgi:anti-anti-sigma factor
MSDQQERPRDEGGSPQEEKPREAVVFTRTERSWQEVVLAAKGPLLHDFADEFQIQLDGLLAGRWPIVTLDLSQVSFIASNPIGKIVFLKKRLEEKQRTFRIRGCSPHLYDQFKSIKFDRIVDTQP